MICIPSINEIKRKIKTDSRIYDKLAKEYNTLVKRERVLGHIVTRNGKVTVKQTAAGKAASKRIVTAWNKVARVGKRLKSELTVYVKYQNSHRAKTPARSRSAIRKRRR